MRPYTNICFLAFAMILTMSLKIRSILSLLVASEADTRLVAPCTVAAREYLFAENSTLVLFFSLILFSPQSGTVNFFRNSSSLVHGDMPSMLVEIFHDPKVRDDDTQSMGLI